MLTRLCTVGNNQLVILPTEIGHLDTLVELDLANNCLVRLPTQLSELELEVMWIDGNPVEYPEQDIISLGTAAILECLKREQQLQQAGMSQRQAMNSTPIYSMSQAELEKIVSKCRELTLDLSSTGILHLMIGL